MSEGKFDFDAAIIGYGPAGVSLALLLARHGLTVAVVEQMMDLYPKPRAIGADHEFMRTMQFCGVADEMEGHISHYNGTIYRGVDGEPIQIFEAPKPPYPLAWCPVFGFVQPDIENMMREKAKTLPGITTYLGWTLTGVNDVTGQIDIAPADGDGTAPKTLTAKYILACDGGASTVRKLLGIPLDDLEFDQEWLVIDALQKKPVDLPDKNIQYCDPHRPATFIKGVRDLRRWELKLRPEETAAQFDDPENVAKVLSDYVDTSAFDIWRSAVYRFHALVARRWRSNRVFLVGDAAHQTPPFLGQGLVAGSRDVFNLAWKIILVEKGGVAPSVLDSYEVERIPHAISVIEAAKKLGLIVGETDPAKARARDDELRQMMKEGKDVRQRLSLIPKLLDGIMYKDEKGNPAKGAGSLFIQPMVKQGDGSRRLDDLVGMDFLVVTKSDALQKSINASNMDFLRRLGARQIVIGAGGRDPEAGEGITTFSEDGGVFKFWMEAFGCEAVVVRPDRYVYGIANSEDEINLVLTALKADVA